MTGDSTDVVVIGSGPNGLVAAITLARAGFEVTVVERNVYPGGAVASAQLTKPGYIHDPYSAFYGLLHAAPVFDRLGLAERVPWAHFDTPVGALIRPDAGAYIHADAERTATALGPDADAWRELTQWWDHAGRRFFGAMLAPFPSMRAGLPFLRAVGPRGLLPTVQMLLRPIEQVALDRFTTEAGRALLVSGISHTDLSLEAAGSTPMTMILAMLAQRFGMPVPVGGAGVLTDALVAMLDEHRGAILTNEAVTRVVVERGRAIGVETIHGRIIRARHAVLADTGAKALFLDLVGADRLPGRFLDRLQTFRYGTGMFKIDLALSSPPAWTDEGANTCGVVHINGTLDDMARANFQARRGLLPDEPMLIVGQQTVADPTRAPRGGATLWIETHVPGVPAAGPWTPSMRDTFVERVLDRVEAFAPGTREKIVGMAVRTPSDLQAENPNLVGGDVGGGSGGIDQQLVFRPVPGWWRYSTPVKGLWLCSASAHPGGGVHGMCGYNAARRVIGVSRRPAGLLRTATAPRRRTKR